MIFGVASRRTRLLVVATTMLTLPACTATQGHGRRTPSAPASTGVPITSAHMVAAVPGWHVERTIPLPRGGAATAVLGTGRYRTFGWMADGESVPHHVGVADVMTGRVVLLPGREPVAVTEGNWSNGAEMMRSETEQAGMDAPMTWRLYRQSLPDGPVRPVDASTGPVPLDGQPMVAFTSAGPVWSRADATCRCYEVVSLPDGAVTPVTLHRQTVSLLVKGDGARALVLSATARVLDPARRSDVVLPVEDVTDGAISGRLVVVYQARLDASGGSAQGTLVGLDVPAGGPARVAWTTAAPQDLDQIGFLDPLHLVFLVEGDPLQTLVMDVRTRTLSPGPPITSVAAKYQLDAGTLTTVDGPAGQQTLVVWRYDFAAR